MEIGYAAPGDVRAVIESLGRTEDVRFSPGNRRLAIAAFIRNRIAVLDVGIAAADGASEVTLTGATEIAASCLSCPHGLDFIDDDTLVVASRKGDLAVFDLLSGSRPADLQPAQILRADEASLLNAPGSLAITRRSGSPPELLVCNNDGHSVTRHRIERGSGGFRIADGETLLRRWLNLPDGICVSHDGHWIAVSNHNTHDVLLYRNTPSLDEHADPDGVLRCVHFPHGLRFTVDGRHIIVADAGAPYVHIYASEGQGWAGARSPVRSVRIMDEATFLRGRHNPQEGGPKGIDIDRGMNVLVVTSEHQPLAFFDLPAMLADLLAGGPVLEVRYELGILEQAERLRTRAAQAESRAAKAEARLLAKKGRKAWRIAGPLRRACSALWRPN
ncbi:MAG TPA: hypothetical protein VFG64_11715 [Dongiaceae bacterium]|nr:hypothetical protein [Dongiaceae bacterium]